MKKSIFNSKITLWIFIAFALFTEGIVFKTENLILDRIANPRKGDVYEVTLKVSHFNLWEVKAFNGGIVTFLENEFGSGLNNIIQNENNEYINKIHFVTKSKLREMFKNGKIIDIDRRNATWPNRIKNY